MFNSLILFQMSSIQTLKRKRKKIRSNQLPEIVTVQCKDNTLKNKRCKKKTRRTSHCWIHLQKYRNLRVKKSKIPNAGFGLFAAKKPFKQGETIGLYTGRRVKNSVR